MSAVADAEAPLVSQPASLEIGVAAAEAGLEHVGPNAEDFYEVPAWAKAGDGITQEDEAVRPWIPWLQGSLAVAILLQGGMYLVSRLTTTCSAGHVHAQPWAWLLALPALALRQYVEMTTVQSLAHIVAEKCRRYRGKGCRAFVLMGTQVRFPTWLALCTALSLLNFVDIGTDSSFAATTSASLSCGGGSELRRLWRASWAQSLPSRLGVPAPELGTLVLAFWCLTLAQMVWPFAKSLERLCVSGDTWSYQSVIVGADIYFTDVALELGEAAGMVSPQKLNYMIAQLGTFESEGTIQNILNYTFGFFVAMPTKVLFSWLGENAVQLNLQSTLFALTVRASRGQSQMSGTQFQALVSIAVSLLTTLLKLTEAWDYFKLLAKVEEEAAAAGSDDPRLKTMRRAAWATRVGCGLLAVSLAYAVAKVIGAFVCEDSLLNLTGCAVLED